MRPASRFAVALLVLVGVAFTVAAAVSPPDPFTQLLYVGPLVVLAVPVAYWLGYRRGTGGRDGRP